MFLKYNFRNSHSIKTLIFGITKYIYFQTVQSSNKKQRHIVRYYFNTYRLLAYVTKRKRQKNYYSVIYATIIILEILNLQIII